MTKRTVLAALVVATTALALAGCLVYARPPTAVVRVGPPLEYGYQPLLYDGYVVYYTDDGIPFYWMGGVHVWVPVHARARYVNHWHSHRSAYIQWHQHRGTQYRSQRYSSQHDNRPTMRPGRDDGRHTIRPAREGDRHSVKPARNRDDKPTLKPKRNDDDDDKKKKTLKPKR